MLLHQSLPILKWSCSNACTNATYAAAGLLRDVDVNILELLMGLENSK